MFGETGIKKGIDLAGGSVITFQADSDAPTDDQMQVVESIFQTRMTNAGYTEARISQGEAEVLLKYLRCPEQMACKPAWRYSKLTFNDAQRQRNFLTVRRHQGSATNTVGMTCRQVQLNPGCQFE